MTLSSKYDINDEVWFVHPLSRMAVVGRVREIRFLVMGKPIYKIGDRKNLIKTGEYSPQLVSNMYHYRRPYSQ